jgi:hypothetical protein
LRRYDIFRGKRDSAWGWSKLINLSKLHDASQGWVDDDGKITLQATVHVVTHEYMPVNRTYRKSLCGLYYERVLQSYFEPFLKDELQRLDKLCGNSVLHKGFSDFWVHSRPPASLPDPSIPHPASRFAPLSGARTRGTRGARQLTARGVCFPGNGLGAVARSD